MQYSLLSPCKQQWARFWWSWSDSHDRCIVCCIAQMFTTLLNVSGCNAGFVGLEEFNWYASGGLLALNTFGPHIVMTCAAQTSFHTDVHGQRSRRRVSCLTYLLLRSVNAWVATCSAAIQRRHLMVWALFAPKFVFEVCFLAVVDICMVSSSWSAVWDN